MIFLGFKMAYSIDPEKVKTFYETYEEYLKKGYLDVSIIFAI
jgi:ABC-type transporter MlaC component